MRRALPAAILGFSLLLPACEDGGDILVIEEPSSTVLVETNADEGEGSLRAALEEASSDPGVNSIQVLSGVGTVDLTGSLEYRGSQDLRIVGNGLVIDGTACACEALVVTGGGDLELLGLSIRRGATGVRVEVPSGRSGIITVRLSNVLLQDNSGHGLLVREQGTSSPAGLLVELLGSTVRGNGAGQGAGGEHGVRVEEVGDGSLTFVVRDSDITGNAGDGVSLAETGVGDLVVDAVGSSFDQNGARPGSPTDPEDGFDAAESGAGNLEIRVLSSTAQGNQKDGMELGESGSGDLRVAINGLDVSGNGGDNLLLREDVDAESGGVPGAGGITATIADVTGRSGDDDGIQIEEFGAGDLSVEIQDSDFGANADDGVTVLQGGTGTGRMHLARVATEGNGGLPVTSTGAVVTEGDDLTTVVRVRNEEDAGFGSLRAALELASADPGVSTVLFETGIGVIEIVEALAYEGSQKLTMFGFGAIVDGDGCACDALVVTGAGDLVLDGLSFRNATGNGLVVSGGGDLTLRNLAVQGMGGHGILMDVPDDAAGLVTVSVEQSSIIGNESHGIFIDDLADAQGGGTGGNSAAGIFLRLEGSLVQGNGFRQGVTDRDGIRVDEGGSGGVEVRIDGSVLAQNAGDGIEINEGGVGDATVDLRFSRVDSNGSQPQDPDRLEDGIDIAEAGPGSVRLDLRGSATQASTVQDNADVGIEIVEEGSGDVVVNLEAVGATGNGAGTLVVTEDADVTGDPAAGSGGILANVNQVTAGGTDRDGIRLTERGLGDLSLTGRGLDSSDNGGDGIWAEELGIGTVLVDLRDSFFDDNGRIPIDPDDLGDGLELREVGAGTVDVRLVQTSLSRNAGRGMDAEEEGSGDLRLNLALVTATGNTWDNLRAVEDLDAAAGTIPGSGSLYLYLGQVTATGSQQDGLQVAEHGDGDLTGQLVGTSLQGNGDDGIDAVQTGNGTGTVQLVGSTVAGNGGDDIAASGVGVTQAVP